jgi:hypothetical protein
MSSQGVSDYVYFRPGAVPVTVGRRVALDAQRGPRRREDVGERERFTPGRVEVRAGRVAGRDGNEAVGGGLSRSSFMVRRDSTGVSLGIACHCSRGVTSCRRRSASGHARRHGYPPAGSGALHEAGEVQAQLLFLREADEIPLVLEAPAVPATELIEDDAPR